MVQCSMTTLPMGTRCDADACSIRLEKSRMPKEESREGAELWGTALQADSPALLSPGSWGRIDCTAQMSALIVC